jgi:hypothetical protein
MDDPLLPSPPLFCIASKFNLYQCPGLLRLAVLTVFSLIFGQDTSQVKEQLKVVNSVPDPRVKTSGGPLPGITAVPLMKGQVRGEEGVNL